VLLYRRLRYGYAFSRIRLTQGQFAMVDPDDFLRLAKYKWFAAKNGSPFYAVRSIINRAGKKSRFYMHREICNVADHMLVDHINHDGLDNRKANLRPVTKAQNTYNRRKRLGNGRSQYKGVCWDKGKKKWLARICLNGTRLTLGSFDDEIEAAKAYDRAAIEYHGEFASLNFPDSTTNEH